MIADKPTDLQFSQLLDALPDAVIWMRAIRDAGDKVVNFRVNYSNKKAEEYSDNKYQVRVGTLLLDDNKHDQARMVQAFSDLCTILETDLPDEYTRFNTTLGAWYLTNRAKLGDGILLVTRTVSQSKAIEQEKQEQTELLQTILDTSLNNVFVYEAIRNEAGQILDFKVRLANPVGREDVRNRYGKEVLGNTLLGFRPSSRETGQFSLFCQVIETGQPVWAQHYYPDVQEWYDTSITKLGDGCVVTGVNITQQKQDLLRYKRLSDLLNSVLNSSANGIKALEAVRETGPDGTPGRIVDFVTTVINQAGATIRGFAKERIIGRRLLKLLPGLLESGIFDQYCEVTETQKSRTIQYKYGDAWYDMTLAPFGDGLVVTFSDISDSRRTQQQISQTANLLQTIINNSPAALVLYEPIQNKTGELVDFRYKLVNPVAATATGLPLDFMQGNTLFTMFPGAAQAGFFARLSHVLETGETQQYEHHFLGDNVDLWAEITMVRQENDVLTVFQYITELKRVQQELERSRAELQTVIDTAQTGIFLFSPVRDERGEVTDFRFQTANRQLASYVGQEPDAVIGALGSTWFPDYKTNGLFDFYNRTYQTGETQRFDFHYDGSGIDAWLDIMSTKPGDQVLVTFSDYTTLKQLQQQLETSVTDLQRSNRNLEQFAYVASHDLQEPLRKIQAFGDIIQNQYAPIIGDSGADMIQRMQSAASRMQMLIKDVLAYSRVSAKLEDHVPIDLNQLLAEVMSDLETVIDDKKAVVTVSPLPILTGDRLQLRQLFQNLISNALKFVKSNQIPEITIAADTVRGRESGFSVSPADGNRLFYCITLADNGIGFEAQHAARIFQVFQRLHGRSEYQGTGIGLAIVQRVIDNHKGYISADGNPGKGATFRILLSSASN